MNPAEQFKIIDNITVEGITADHVWYNANLLTQKMSFWATDFQKLVSVMEARHKEHLKIIDDLLTQRGDLRREIAALKSAAKE
jgi:hypothetical protein